jgi:hypothetical protein
MMFRERCEMQAHSLGCIADRRSVKSAVAEFDSAVRE